MAGITFHYPAGATPLDLDDANDLIPAHITTQGQLNEWELRNILEAEEWAFGRRHKALLSLDFMKTLHKRMLGDTWRWAGRFRVKELNLGFVPPADIAPALTNLCADVQAQLHYTTWGPKEIAARFHHRLTNIHPFPNGNGRFSRMLADLLLVQSGAPRFDWGAGSLGSDGEVRNRYISALREADAHNFAPLLDFLGARSTELA